MFLFDKNFEIWRPKISSIRMTKYRIRKINEHNNFPYQVQPFGEPMPGMRYIIIDLKEIALYDTVLLKLITMIWLLN